MGKWMLLVKEVETSDKISWKVIRMISDFNT